MRCAIYTRKSTEEGLDRDFNSLDAQRESAEAYVLSQREAGWTALAERYDDGGYTGANLDRPALERLLADIEAGLIDCLIVNRVDRLSRSLLDFARLMSTFEKRGVNLVSVTQQFNTTASMGRLTLNILLSFADYAERAIMQSGRVKVAVWPVFWPRGTPHYPGSKSEAFSASGSSGRIAFRLASVRHQSNECGVRKTAMTDRLYTFNTSPEQLRRLGARGGRTYARNQRARRALLSTPPEVVPPRATPPATAAESIAVLDARFPWLRGAEKRLS